jgi:hypothetical protein
MLFVGAAALLSGMIRSIVHGFHLPPWESPFFFGSRRFLQEREICLTALAFSVLIGVACGCAVAVSRGPRLRRFIVGVCGGSALGGLAGAQLISKGDLPMTLIGSLMLIVFGLAIRFTSSSPARADDEIEWFRRDDPFDRPADGQLRKSPDRI